MQQEKIIRNCKRIKLIKNKIIRLYGVYKDESEEMWWEVEISKGKGFTPDIVKFNNLAYARIFFNALL